MVAGVCSESVCSESDSKKGHIERNQAKIMYPKDRPLTGSYLLVFTIFPQAIIF